MKLNRLFTNYRTDRKGNRFPMNIDEVADLMPASIAMVNGRLLSLDKRAGAIRLCHFRSSNRMMEEIASSARIEWDDQFLTAFRLHSALKTRLPNFDSLGDAIRVFELDRKQYHSFDLTKLNSQPYLRLLKSIGQL